MKPLFVTSTGTDIGKTFVCCRLIEELGGTRNLRVIKPIATGVDPEDLDATDTAALLAAQRRPLDARRFRETTPWYFRAPLSPDLAAEREGASVPFEEIVAFSCAPTDADMTIIEGIGGVMVPLDTRRTVLDWMSRIDPLVWLVTGSYLGTLSHTLTALRVLAERQLEVGAIVISESAAQSTTAADTAAVIARFSGPIPIVTVPRPPPPAAQRQLLAPLLAAGPR